MTPVGDATVAWTAAGRVRSADARPGRAFGGVQTVGTVPAAAADPPSLASDDAGNLVAAWSTAGKVFSATRRVGGAWSRQHLIESAPQAGLAQAAVNPAGAGAISFLTAGTAARLVYRHPGGSFGDLETPPLPSYGAPSLGLDDTGRATVSMRSFSETFTRTGDSVAAQRHPLVGWGKASTVPGTSNIYQSMLAEPSGAVSYVTTQNRGGVIHTVRRPDGSVIGPATLAPDADAPDAALNLRGDMLAAWISPAEGQSEQGRVFVADRPAGSAFGEAQPISGTGGARDPHVAVNDAGQAAVLWARGGNVATVAVREDPAAGALPFPPRIVLEQPRAPRLDADGVLRVVARCVDRGCTATPNGTLVLGGRDLFAATGSPKRLKAGRRTGVTLRFGSKRAKQVRKALKAGRKPWVGFTIRALGSSPRPMTVTRRVELK
jgi:hypothetical protein